MAWFSKAGAPSCSEPGQLEEASLLFIRHFHRGERAAGKTALGARHGFIFPSPVVLCSLQIEPVPVNKLLLTAAVKGAHGMLSSAIFREIESPRGAEGC